MKNVTRLGYELFQAYQIRNQQKGPEKRLAGLEKYSPEQLFFISYARVSINAIKHKYSCEYIIMYVCVILHNNQEIN